MQRESWYKRETRWYEGCYYKTQTRTEKFQGVGKCWEVAARKGVRRAKVCGHLRHPSIRFIRFIQLHRCTPNELECSSVNNLVERRGEHAWKIGLQFSSRFIVEPQPCYKFVGKNQTLWRTSLYRQLVLVTTLILTVTLLDTREKSATRCVCGDTNIFHTTFLRFELDRCVYHYAYLRNKNQ